MGVKMEQALLPFKRYADFRGRATRTEYWGFSLFNLVVYLALFAILMLGAAGGEPGFLYYTGLIILIIYAFGIIIPSYAVMARRFHDTGHTGWMILLCFIPFIGGLIVLVFMFLPGNDGANQYGDDPR